MLPGGWKLIGWNADINITYKMIISMSVKT